jgi:hypothetical protein
VVLKLLAKNSESGFVLKFNRNVSLEKMHSFMRNKVHRRTVLFGLGVLLPSLIVGISSCNNSPQANSQGANAAQNVSTESKAPDKVTIAYQPA